MNTSTQKRLKVLNFSIGTAHLAQAILMLVLGSALSLPVTTSFLTNDPIAVQNGVVPEVAFRLGIAVSVAAFLFLAAIDHLLMAAPGVNNWYNKRIDARDNYARWIEYSISASIMMVLIAMFAGIRDIAALLAIFGANSAMILFGLLMERQQEPGKTKWSAFWFGSIIGMVPWIAVAIYVMGPDTVPGFVYAITVTQFILFCTFALNMALQYLEVGKWKSYVYGEVVYIWLSLAAKSLLAWLIYANVLRS